MSVKINTQNDANQFELIWSDFDAQAHQSLILAIINLLIRTNDHPDLAQDRKELLFLLEELIPTSQQFKKLHAH